MERRPREKPAKRRDWAPRPKSRRDSRRAPTPLGSRGRDARTSTDQGPPSVSRGRVRPGKRARPGMVSTRPPVSLEGACPAGQASPAGHGEHKAPRQSRGGVSGQPARASTRPACPGNRARRAVCPGKSRHARAGKKAQHTGARMEDAAPTSDGPTETKLARSGLKPEHDNQVAGNDARPADVGSGKD